jgi:hypothetical protein
VREAADYTFVTSRTAPAFAFWKEARERAGKGYMLTKRRERLMLELVCGAWGAIARRQTEVRGKIRELDGARSSIMLKVMIGKWGRYASGELLEDGMIGGAGEGEGNFSHVARVLGDMTLMEDSLKAWKMSITVREST